MSCVIHWTSQHGYQSKGTAYLPRERANMWVDQANYRSIRKMYGIFQYVIDHEVARGISELCVVKGLPSGDPSWMSRIIGSYLHPIPKK